MEMFHGHEGFCAASYESLSSYVDIGQRRTAPMPQELTVRLEAVKAAHAVLPLPWQVGHRISVRPPAKAASG